MEKEQKVVENGNVDTKNIKKEEKIMEKATETDKNIIINDVKPETRAKLAKSKAKDNKKSEKKGGDTEKPAKKSTKTPTKGGNLMDREQIEKTIKTLATKAKLTWSQGAGRVNSSKPAPLQVRNSAGEVIVAARAGELLFHLPYEEVVQVGRPHGGGWPHCTKLFYNTCSKAEVEKAIINALSEEHSVKHWKKVYGSKGRIASSKKAVDPAARLKALQKEEAAIKAEMAAAKKELAAKKKTAKSPKTKKTSKTPSAVISKVAEASS